ncbi:MAG: riboflavin biosynthesis protein RibD [Bacteroidetes bacterium GWF2_43_63]|nr:MAG: riboflavin biosynthesis protein RibD [Bacteroidetes bacterium GWE2_42_42]OFY54717.1 MAG: riboflavin biosynthesis protein RibD [Bacteroidetes bacterium GWF2_43_63]HBG69710.1 bifunctional diaminohydroxyphosphoribosylaminopyrimidine deaminase/5-amino-6-(5-phosphoribosylamino)uracil reductase RibD [Bacteroidales bacterium]HCB63131.1 bifunctional diaminohydroxyphosphoribosylaminopyrimidine deaminase/5-amino-6-(5-phosphoribosylamino)uracil reductase RibD [Bacteroidales bacterium]HCY22154.1 bi
MNTDEQYMHRCHQLAENGFGKTEPNPYVGAVIVHQGKIIGEGFHERFGGPHAEVNAIASVFEKHLLKESTLYVNLEPCSHHGKTPPCADLIIQMGIPQVVVAMQDPNVLVSGNGIKKLRAAGIQVKTGILEEEAKWLNRRFVTFHTQKRPYIILKWAQTKDGFIDIDRSDPAAIQKDNWITGPELKTLVHRWRTQEQAILIGYNTLVNDNPQLTVREWTGRNPQRILVADTLPDEHYNIFGNDQKTIVFNPIQNSITEKAEYIKLDFDKDLLKNILNGLFEKNISSVMIEGGRQILESFISSGLWDEARVLIGNKMFGKGLPAPVLKAKTEIGRKEFDKDLMQIFKNNQL